MLDVAARRADSGTDVNRPFPPGLVGGAAYGHAANMNEFEFSLFERSDFIGFFKTFENCLKHGHNSLANRDLARFNRSSLPDRGRQYRNCMASKTPRETPPDACGPTFHRAKETAQRTPADRHTGHALPKAMCRS